VLKLIAGCFVFVLVSPIWRASEKPDRDEWAASWERRAFKEARACDVIACEVPTLSSGGQGAQAMVGDVSLAIPSVDVLTSPLQQGSSTLFVTELLARTGVHRAPILNSDRFVTGLITQSMLISIISQYRHMIPTFQEMPVANMMQFLAPHRLVIVNVSSNFPIASAVVPCCRSHCALLLTTAGLCMFVSH